MGQDCAFLCISGVLKLSIEKNVMYVSFITNERNGRF